MLKETFGVRIEKTLTPANVKQMEKSIVGYVDRNSEILMSFDMSTRYSFADADRAVIYDAVGITEPEMVAAVKESKQIHKANRIQSNPFYLLSLLVVRQLLSQKDTKHAQLVMTYMSLMMYVSVHKGMFEYGANKQIMDYTIAHLNKNYRLSHMTSIYAFIEDNAKTTLETYTNKILSGGDADLASVVDALWVRTKQKIKKIAQRYYENHKSGRYLNADTDNFTDDANYREIDNQSFIIDRLVNRTYTRLINNQFDNRLLKYAITQSDVSYTKLKNLITDIIDSDEGEARKVISSILEYYLLQSGKSPDYIARGDFIVYMKTAYGTNTDMPQMVYVKTQIDQWLADNMYKYGRANYGKTIRQSYRKSIYMFFVLLINMEAKA